MIEEATLAINYTQGNSSGLILSPNSSNGFNNTNGMTKVVMSFLPNTFWLNLVYLPGTPTSNGCDTAPFLLYNGSSTSLITTKLGCGSVRVNSEVLAGTLRSLDVIITGTQQITIAVNRSDSLYSSFKLYYSSKYTINYTF